VATYDTSHITVEIVVSVGYLTVYDYCILTRFTGAVCFGDISLSLDSQILSVIATQ
jgi:hypothetical protein